MTENPTENPQEQEDAFDLEMMAMAHGGMALGRHRNKTIFVPYAIPGELIAVQVTENKGRIAFAEGVRLLDASADRVFPRCPHFGPRRCGGCQWQHIDYPAQLLIKQDVLADQLERVGGFADADIQPVIPSPDQWRYNYHMLLRADAAGVLGFIGADGVSIYPVDECHVLHPALMTLYEQFDLDFTALDGLKLQIGTNGAAMLILLVKNEEDVPELTIDLPASVNILLPDDEPVNLIGDAHSTYAIGGRDFRVTAGSAIRANIAQIDTLARVVVDLLGLPPKATILDLYAGVGVFSAYLASDASLVTLVESHPPAVTDADENLRDFENVDVIEGTAEEFLSGLDEEPDYDAAVLDPPPNGLSIEAVDLLGESGIPRLVYISSDPATLARDAKRLVAHGYTLGRVQPIDFDPHTYLIESVAVFNRN